MQTFTKAKHFVDYPHYQEKREEALSRLDLQTIDRPIVDIIKDISTITHCFSLQSCYGHFVHKGQRNRMNVDPLSNYDESSRIEYKIAYIALCIQNNDLGRKLYQDLKAITKIDPDNIQFGSATWFWQTHVNSYVVQVEPDRYKKEDKAFVNINEALHLEIVKNQMFERLRGIVKEHQRLNRIKKNI